MLHDWVLEENEYLHKMCCPERVGSLFGTQSDTVYTNIGNQKIYFLSKHIVIMSILKYIRQLFGE